MTEFIRVAESLRQDIKNLIAENEALKTRIKELEKELEFYKKGYNPYWAGENDDN